MKIRIASLRKGINTWNEQVDPVDFELDPERYRHPVSVDLAAEKLIGKIRLEIVTKTAGSYTCDRCSDEFSIEISGNCSVVFIERDSPLPNESPGDELRSYIYGQDELDLQQELRDAVLLSLPMQIICCEECKGLCSGCGANLNNEACSCAVLKE